jgi:Na+/melibiose symporter-like transporter
MNKKFFTAKTVSVLGILVALLFFASEHPAVGSNWLILFLNPLPLFLLVWKLCGNRAEKHQRYMLFMMAEMVLIGIVLLLSPQVVPPMVYVLLAALALRGVMGYQTLRKAI